MLERLRLPRLAALRELGIRKLDVDRALHGVDDDDVAFAQESDRSAIGRFGADMADAEARASRRRSGRR